MIYFISKLINRCIDYTFQIDEIKPYSPKSKSLNAINPPSQATETNIETNAETNSIAYTNSLSEILEELVNRYSGGIRRKYIILDEFRENEILFLQEMLFKNLNNPRSKNNVTAKGVQLILNFYSRLNQLTNQYSIYLNEEKYGERVTVYNINSMNIFPIRNLPKCINHNDILLELSSRSRFNLISNYILINDIDEQNVKNLTLLFSENTLNSKGSPLVFFLDIIPILEFIKSLLIFQSKMPNLEFAEKSDDIGMELIFRRRNPNKRYKYLVLNGVPEYMVNQIIRNNTPIINQHGIEISNEEKKIMLQLFYSGFERYVYYGKETGININREQYIDVFNK